MKYLEKYRLFESRDNLSLMDRLSITIDDIDDLFIHLKDSGYKIKYSQIYTTEKNSHRDNNGIGENHPNIDISFRKKSNVDRIDDFNIRSGYILSTRETVSTIGEISNVINRLISVLSNDDVKVYHYIFNINSFSIRLTFPMEPGDVEFNSIKSKSIIIDSIESFKEETNGHISNNYSISIGYNSDYKLSPDVVDIQSLKELIEDIKKSGEGDNVGQMKGVSTKLFNHIFRNLKKTFVNIDYKLEENNYSIKYTIYNRKTNIEYIKLDFYIGDEVKVSISGGWMKERQLKRDIKNIQLGYGIIDIKYL